MFYCGCYDVNKKNGKKVGVSNSLRKLKKHIRKYHNNIAPSGTSYFIPPV